MANTDATLEYGVHQKLNLEKVNKEINQEWSKALKDSQFLEQVKKAGVDPQSLPQSGSEVIAVKKEGEGITGEEVKLLVTIATTFAPVVATIVKDLWVHVILPRIRADQGDDSIGKEKKTHD